MNKTVTLMFKNEMNVLTMKKYTLIIISMLLIACSDNPIPKPKKLIETEKMENILYDMIILQASESYENKYGVLDVNVSEFIYKKYKVDSTTILQNQKYYSGNIKEYSKMYKNVLDRIQNQKNEIDTLIKNQKIQKTTDTNINTSQIK